MRELLEAIERVKKRIQKHEAQLRGNEMLTRYALIDPILRALGWDTEDPEQVVPEIPTPQGRPDYGLLWEGKTLVMVEAKSLGSNLESARNAGFHYCWQNRVPYFVVTDGDVWELHDLREMGGRQIFRVQLSRDNPGDAARQLLALWRPAMPEVVCAPSMVVKLPEEETPQPPEGIPLSKLRQTPVTGRKVSGRLRFPDGEEMPVNRWKNLLVAVAKWALPKVRARLPVKGPHGKTVIAADKSTMSGPEPVDDAWVETRCDAQQCVKRACYILEAAKVDPNQVVLIGWAPAEQRKRQRGARG